MTKGLSEASAMWIAIVAELMLQKTLQRAYPHRTHTGHVQARSIEKTPKKSPNIWETTLVCHFFCPHQVGLSTFSVRPSWSVIFCLDQVGLGFFVLTKLV